MLMQSTGNFTIMCPARRFLILRLTPAQMELSAEVKEAAKNMRRRKKVTAGL
jgi:hypothetical protein